MNTLFKVIKVIVLVAIIVTLGLIAVFLLIGVAHYNDLGETSKVLSGLFLAIMSLVASAVLVSKL